ncbi:hypothetical protein Dehly_1311 [Dehalogenimonas lykanthroporepellens BL-DC-9]|jgi:hypothetical protein|nr:hypothetical protein Dehly_1311 [Dehalogenimonas lykanthroporepellens BL-DC-9]
MKYIAPPAFGAGLFLRWALKRWMANIRRALADQPGLNLGTHNLTLSPKVLTDEAGE